MGDKSVYLDPIPAIAKIFTRPKNANSRILVRHSIAFLSFEPLLVIFAAESCHMIAFYNVIFGNPIAPIQGNEDVIMVLAFWFFVALVQYPFFVATLIRFHLYGC